MGNTYTQLHIQFVFAVKRRDCLITEQFRIQLEKVMCSIISKMNCKPLAIYCNPDHVHVLVGMHPNVSSSKLMERLKSESTLWINSEKKTKFKFTWQEGYGAFSYSKSQINHVINYILNQSEHHKKRSFKDEYLEILQKSEIEYDDKYIFDWLD